MRDVRYGAAEHVEQDESQGDCTQEMMAFLQVTVLFQSKVSTVEHASPSRLICDISTPETSVSTQT
jgi:hypothetical protein